MDLAGYVACICEGSAEQAIMEILIEHGKVIFSGDQLLSGDIIRCRNAKTFAKTYLRKGFDEKITVLRILDSRSEQFNLDKAYVDKVKVINIITAPEIEMLIIVNEGRYDEFKRSGMKPSEFCKIKMNYHSVKSYKFVKDYFSDIDCLISSIQEYKRISKNRQGEYTLADLIRT